MKFTRVETRPASTRLFVFRIGKRERDCFLATVELYPLVDINYQPLSRTGAVQEEAQQYLEEAMTDLRKSRRMKVEEFLQKAKFKRAGPHGFELTIPADEADWLLQILNEVRVGCWITLGRPEMDQVEDETLKEEHIRFRVAMDLCAYFQAAILEAFEAPAG